MAKAPVVAFANRIDAPEPVTWAGRGPSSNTLCLGTETGRLIWIDPDRGIIHSPSNVAGSGEAINGAAFTGNLIAVSNRSEVVIQDLKSGIRPVVLEGGAHGVIASESGKIVAPRGREGLLISARSDDGHLVHKTLISPEANPYFYQTVQVGPSENGREWFASACRDDGIALIRVGPGSAPGDFRMMSQSKPRSGQNMDIVSLCPLNRPGYPYALAFLAMDGTVCFTADVRNDAFEGIAFDKLNGTPYAVQSAQGHLFVLTSEKCWVMKDFADRAVRDPRGSAREPIKSFGLAVDAVDFSIVDEEYLVLVHDLHLTVNRVSELFQESRPAMNGAQVFQPSEMMATSWGAA